MQYKETVKLVCRRYMLIGVASVLVLGSVYTFYGSFTVTGFFRDESRISSEDSPLDYYSYKLNSQISDKSSLGQFGKTRSKCAFLKQTYSSKCITDERLVDIYQACVHTTSTSLVGDNAAGLNTIHIGPDLFNAVFSSKVGLFHQMVCQSRNVNFSQGKYKQFAALASVQGSGNTWTRLLLEELTGVYTGTVYKGVREAGVFKGSTACALNNTIIVKTHLMSTMSYKNKDACANVANAHFKSAIYLLRNPYNALLAEFNRRHSGKVGVTTFKDFQSKEWDEWVHTFGRQWYEHVEYWLSLELPVHVLVYENLQINTLWELYKVANFLDFHVTFDTMFCMMSKGREDRQRQFLRQKPKWLNADSIYSWKQKQLINNYISLHAERLGLTYNLTKQLQSYVS